MVRTARRTHGSSARAGIWQLSRLNDPDTVYAGVEDAALFRTTDGGKSWGGNERVARTRIRSALAARRGGMCLHSIIVDPSDRKRIFIAISAAGVFRTDDGGESWKPINKGLYSKDIPDPTAEVGHRVHHIADQSMWPGVLFMQKHWDVMRSDNAGDSWEKISGNLPTDFGFVIHIHAHEPETVYVVPIKSDPPTFSARRKIAVRISCSGGHEWEELAKGLPEKNCYVNAPRDAMAVDQLDQCGVYFGIHRRTGVRIGFTPAIRGCRLRGLAAVLSIEVQTLS